MSNRKKDRSGFTLVELTIALAIVAILVVAAFSNLFQWLDHSSAVGFRKEILSRSEEARSRAMATNIQHRVRIDLDGETVLLQRGNAGTNSNSWSNVGPIVAGSRGAGVQEIIYDAVTVSASVYSFIYNPGGQLLIQDNASAILPLVEAKIHLAGEGPGDRSTIRLYGYTSKARLEENGWN